jgi:hypothetical protein
MGSNWDTSFFANQEFPAGSLDQNYSRLVRAAQMPVSQPARSIRGASVEDRLGKDRTQGCFRGY